MPRQSGRRKQASQGGQPQYRARTAPAGVRQCTELLAESQQEEAKRKTVTLRRLAANLVAGLIGGALLLAIVLIFDVAGAREWLRARTTPIRSIAVLPLENLSGDPQQEYFVDGMTDELITTLARLGGLRWCRGRR